MKRVLILASAVLVIFFILGFVPNMATAAEKISQSKILTDVSPEDISAIAEKNDLKCVQKTSSSGNPMLVISSKSFFIEVPILVHFYEKNDNGRYYSISLITYISPKSKQSRLSLLEKVNDHNNEKRFIRMSLGTKNDVIIDNDIYLRGGVQPAVIEEALLFFGKNALLIAIEMIK